MPANKARAIATMFAGLTAANVLGVPLGTLLGQQLGWRSTFWAITAIGLVAMVAIALLVPAHTGTEEKPTQLGHELGAFRNGQVWASLLVTVLGYGGMFGAFTCMACTLTRVSGFASSAVPWLLVLFGVGLFAGNRLGGRAADRSVPRTLIVVLVLLTALLTVFSVTADSKPVTIVALLLMGGLGFATVPGADADHGTRRRRTDPCLGREHRRLQRGQRVRRMDRWRHHHRVPRLHLTPCGPAHWSPWPVSPCSSWPSVPYVARGQSSTRGRARNRHGRYMNSLGEPRRFILFSGSDGMLVP